MRHNTLLGSGLLVCGTLILAVPSSVEGQGKIPPRQPIFLNNNASLYTFPNPNFGLPSQLPFAFVAVAHEDCRLLNNGAMLMPQHRIMAAECQQAGMMNPNTPTNPQFVICPCTGTLETPATCALATAILCNGPGPFPFPFAPGGYNRMRQPYQPVYAYGGPSAGYGGNYASYNPGASIPCCGNGSSALTTASQGQSQQQWYKGFGTHTETKFKGFQPTLGSNALASFGSGFDQEKESSVQELEQAEEKK